MKQLPFQEKKLTLNKTTITFLGNTFHKGHLAMDVTTIPLGVSTLPECNTTTTTGTGTGIAY